MRRVDARRPNLFLVGAPKAGTTSLHDHLSQHPDVFMSPLKETMHFAEEMRYANFAPEYRQQNERNAESLREYFAAEGPLGPRFAGVVESREDYLRLFEGARGERVVGEATPSYLWSQTAAKGIAKFAPEAKILMVLRNPVERAFSQYLQIWNSGGFAKSFGEYIRGCMKHEVRSEVGLFSPGLRLGLYAEHLQRYRDAFAPEQIGVWMYEDTRALGFHAEVFRFLGVNEEFKPDTARHFLQQRIPRVRMLEPMMQRVGAVAGKVMPAGAKSMVKPVMYRKRETMTMSATERAMLVEYYERDVKRLEGMLGKDLSAWLQ